MSVANAIDRYDENDISHKNISENRTEFREFPPTSQPSRYYDGSYLYQYKQKSNAPEYFPVQTVQHSVNEMSEAIERSNNGMDTNKNIIDQQNREYQKDVEESIPIFADNGEFNLDKIEKFENNKSSLTDRILKIIKIFFLLLAAGLLQYLITIILNKKDMEKYAIKKKSYIVLLFIISFAIYLVLLSYYPQDVI